MRNIDRIRGMTPSELAFFLMDHVTVVESKCGPIKSIDGVQMYDDKDCLFWLLEENIDPSIRIVNETISKTLNYLQTHYPTNEKVYMHIAEGYDCIETPDGAKGFGLYNPDTHSIYIAENVPEKEGTLIETISHEYYHFMQHCAGRPFDEEEAEEFALETVRKLGGEKDHE